MSARHRDVEFRTLRAALDRTGDVTIGAYARQVRRRRIALALLGVLMVGAAVLIYFAMTGGPPSWGATVERLRCERCQYEFDVRVDPQREYPTSCPNCKHMTARPLWQCYDCDLIFLPDDPSIPVRCPRCGGYGAGALKPRQNSEN